jgi:hypothetical protein
VLLALITERNDLNDAGGHQFAKHISIRATAWPPFIEFTENDIDHDNLSRERLKNPFGATCRIQIDDRTRIDDQASYRIN